MRRSLAVEVDRVALADVGRADTEAHVFRVEQLEIDQPHERGPQRRRVVEAERAFRAPGLQPGRRHARGIEAVDPGGDAGERAPLVEDAAGEIAVEQRLGGDAVGDQLPELAQALDPPLRRIAGNDGAVDRTDRDAGDPVRQIAPLRQGLVDAGLIGTECAAALEHKADLPAVRGQGFLSLARFGLRGRRRGLAGPQVGRRFSPARVVDSIFHGLSTCQWASPTA